MPRIGRRPAVPLSLLWTLLVSAASSRRGFATPVNNLLDFSPGSFRTHVNATVRSYGDKVVAVWNDSQTPSSTTEPRVHYAVSTDSGATFLDLGAPPTPNGTGRWRGDPQLAVDPANGTFFLVAVGSSGTVPVDHYGLWECRGLFSGSVLNWTTPVLVRADVTTSFRQVGLLALDNSLTGNVLHLLYQNPNGTIDYQRSTDGNGFVWSTPLTLSNEADLGSVAYPQLASGPGGATYAAWGGSLSLATQPIRIRTSMDHGATWGPEQTITTRMNAALPGRNMMPNIFLQRPPFSLAVNRIAGSTTFGQVALAWSEPWDFTDEPFPALTGTVMRNEIEPNNDQGTGTYFNAGDALRGTIAAGKDDDFWTSIFTAGESRLFWADSTSPGTTILGLSVLGPDGFAHLNGFSGGSSAVFAFRAPTTGTYAFWVHAAVGIDTTFYRIRTQIGSPSAGEGRDAGDIAVAFQSNGNPWVVRHQPFGPVGYDDYEPTIGYGPDGLDYVTWYDLSSGSMSGNGRLVVARNLTGVDPVPSPPVTVSDAEMSFYNYSSITPPQFGCANDVYGEGRRLYMAWTDTRNLAPDVYEATLATDAVPIAFPIDTSVTPGTMVPLHGLVLNRNAGFAEKVVIRVSGPRSWLSQVGRDSVPPGATGAVSIPLAIPDTATAGPIPVTVQYERQSGIVLGSDNVVLLIKSVSGVGDHAPIARLEPIAPNPVRGPARIAFSLAHAGDARVEVFGVRGERIRTLLRGSIPAGEQSLRWDGRDEAGHAVPAGLYFVALESGAFRAVQQMVVLK